MSLSELARADARAIIALDGDSVILTAPQSLGLEPFAIPCNFVRTGATRDLDGLLVVGETTALSVSLAELASHGITDPESLKTPGWLALVGGVSYKFGEALPDYTVGIASIALKKSAA